MKDYELVNEMLKPITKNEIRAGYPVLTEDHFFFQLVTEFMTEKTKWTGTVTDLLSEMKRNIRSFIRFTFKFDFRVVNFCRVFYYRKSESRSADLF